LLCGSVWRNIQRARTMPKRAANKATATEARLIGSEQTCSTCDYWELSPTRAYGKCRRYPPTPDARGQVHEDGAVDGLHVRTAGEEWCGEWRAREAAPEVPPPDETTDEPSVEQPQRDLPPEEQPAQDAATGDRDPILDENSYARLRRLYTVEEIRTLVLTGGGEEETALCDLARLEEAYQKRRA
jgi:hypothetical protein